MMKNRFVRTLILLLCFTAAPLPAQSSEPKNPDSKAYKKCMADCNTPGTKEYKTRSYLRNSCEDVCYYADDELATIYVQAVNQATGEKISAFVDIKGPTAIQAVTVDTAMLPSMISRRALTPSPLKWSIFNPLP